jgi:hypothetical protein
VKTRLATGLAIVGLALAAAPTAFGDPPPAVVPLSPDDGASFTARADQIIFQASTTATPTVMEFYVAKDNEADADGVLSNWIEHIRAGPTSSDPGVYEASPDQDAGWPKKPGTYYWQAAYFNCGQTTDACLTAGPIRSLTVNALPPPNQVSPDDGATIPYGGEMTFSVQEPLSYTPDGTTPLYVEFAKGNDLAPDGTFTDADHYFSARLLPTGGNIYEYRFTTPFSQVPGTYYWIAERFDCYAEADCYVTNDQVRSFAVASPDPGTGGPAPNTFLTRHPGHRTHKRRVTFAFSSNIATASFRCFYTEGWSRCRSPQTFRHLKPGRYRFKVRAVANGKRDPTPASWLFKVRR